MELNRYVLLQECEEGTILYNSINGATFMVPAAKDDLSSYLSTPDNEDALFAARNLFLERSDLGENVDDIVRSTRNSIKYSNRFASFTIHLNYSCNMMCSYCYQNDIASKKVMSREVESQLYVFLAKVRLANNLSRVDIAFIGGEPLLNVDLMLRIVRKANEIFDGVSVTYSLVTNGTLLTESVIQRIAHVHFRTIQITLDGSENTHDTFRMYKDQSGTYDDILRNLALSQRYHLPVIINCNINEKTYCKVESLFQDLLKHNVAFPVCFSLIFDCASSKHRQGYIGSRRYSQIWLQAHMTAAAYGQKWPPFYRLSYMMCGVEKTNDYNISPDGKLFKCLSGMDKSDFYVADIGDYGSAHYYDRLSSFVEYDNMKEKCFKCKFAIVCGGWCRYKKMIYGDYCPYEELEMNDLALLKYSDWR